MAHNHLSAQQQGQEPAARPLRAVLLSLTLVLLGLAAALAVAIWIGREQPGNGESATPLGHAAPIVTLWRVLVALVVINVLARTMGSLAVRIRQPRVIGEIVAGLVFGPSVLGAVWPQATAVLLPPGVTDSLNLLGMMSLILYMFTVGWEFDVDHMRQQGRVVLPAALAMTALPLALGAAAAYPFAAVLKGDTSPVGAYVLFLGVALSVTAFPVLARIVKESGLAGTRLGRTALLAAAGSDVLAWCALALPLALARNSSPTAAALSLGATTVLVATLLIVVRPALRRLGERLPQIPWPAPLTIAVIFGLVFSLAATTELLGVHAIFGAFLAGLILPRRQIHFGEVPRHIDQLNRSLLLPVYFAAVGLQVDIRGLRGDSRLVLAGVILLGIAVLAKVGAAVPVGLAMGWSPREAGGLGILMNARGVTEIVVLSAGLTAGLINTNAFTILVVMAVATTVMTAPALHWLRIGPPARQKRTESHLRSGL